MRLGVLCVVFCVNILREAVCQEDEVQQSIFRGPNRDNLMLLPIKTKRIQHVSWSENLPPPIWSINSVSTPQSSEVLSIEHEFRRHPQVASTTVMEDTKAASDVDKTLSNLVMQLDDSALTPEKEAQLMKKMLKGTKKVGKKAESSGAAFGHFENKEYKLMAPASLYEKPFTIAMVHFTSELGTSMPKFSVENDKEDFVQIGEVVRREVDGNLESSVSVELKANTELSTDKIPNGVYPLVLVAMEGNRRVTVPVTLELLDLSPVINPIKSSNHSEENIHEEVHAETVTVHAAVFSTVLEHHNNNESDSNEIVIPSKSNEFGVSNVDIGSFTATDTSTTEVIPSKSSEIEVSNAKLGNYTSTSEVPEVTATTPDALDENKTFETTSSTFESTATDETTMASEEGTSVDDDIDETTSHNATTAVPEMSTSQIPTEVQNPGVVEIPTPVISLMVVGATNKALVVRQPVERGLPVEEFHFMVDTQGQDTGPIDVSVNRNDLFEVKPAKVLPGEAVHLIIRDASSLNDMDEFELKISADLFGEHVSETLMVSVEMASSESASNEEVSTSERKPANGTVEEEEEKATTEKNLSDGESADDKAEDKESEPEAHEEELEKEISTKASIVDKVSAAVEQEQETDAMSTSTMETASKTSETTEVKSEDSKTATKEKVEVTTTEGSTTTDGQQAENMERVENPTSTATSEQAESLNVTLAQEEVDEEPTTSSNTNASEEVPIEGETSASDVEEEPFKSSEFTFAETNITMETATEGENDVDSATEETMNESAENNDDIDVSTAETNSETKKPVVPVIRETTTSSTTTTELPTADQAESEHAEEDAENTENKSERDDEPSKDYKDFEGSSDMGELDGDGFTTQVITLEELATTEATMNNQNEPEEESSLEVVPSAEEKTMFDSDEDVSTSSTSVSIPTLPQEFINSSTEKSLEIEIDAEKINDVKERVDSGERSDEELVEKIEKKPLAEEKTDMPKDYKRYEFSISEVAKDGDVVGELQNADGYLMGGNAPFNMVNNQIMVSCEDDTCLDRERVDQYKFMLIPTSEDPSDSVIQIVVNVENVNDNPPTLSLSDKALRISNGHLLSPFAIEVNDPDASEENHVALSGPASNFLTLSKVNNNLYEVKVASFPPRGKFALNIELTDTTGKFDGQSQAVDVVVQNTESKAHFRRPRYERSVSAGKLRVGSRLVETELEGVAIDSVRFFALEGNPGWLTVDDYNGRVTVAREPNDGFITGRYKVRVAAADRDTSAIVADCEVVVNILHGKDPLPLFEQPLITAVFNREDQSDVEVPLSTTRPAPISLIPGSVSAVDENGLAQVLPASAITISSEKLRIRRSVMPTIRVVQAKISAEDETATVVVYLTSDAEVIHRKNKEASRPVFAHPWTSKNNKIQIRLPEEVPEGTIVTVLPANNPVTGESVKVQIDGANKDKFRFDSTTGMLEVAARFDYETLSEDERLIALVLKAGETGYESEAVVEIRIVDIDDNPPRLLRENLPMELSISENAASGTELLEIGVEDADSMSAEELQYILQGDGRENFAVKQRNGSVVLVVAPGAQLDRETLPTHALQLIASDAAGNSDQVLITVNIDDDNDNAPIFEKEEYVVQAVENWSEGVLLDSIVARDSDFGENAVISYKLKDENEYFAIDQSTGAFRVAKDLFGLAREEPYNVSVEATDGGSLPMSSNVLVRVKISSPLYSSEGEKGDIRFKEPSNNFVLKVPENTAPLTPVFTVRAHVVGTGSDDEDIKNIQYSAKALVPEDEGYFNIDQSTGELYTKQPLDYEEKKHFSLLLTAWSAFTPNVTANRLLRIEITDFNDEKPTFVQGNNVVFVVSEEDTAPGKVVGRLVAVDNDSPPFNKFEYHILPGCNPDMFGKVTIDKSSGEVSLVDVVPSQVPPRIELCAVATTSDEEDVRTMNLDPLNSSMTRFSIEIEKAREFKSTSSPKLSLEQKMKTTSDSSFSSLRVPIITQSLPKGILFNKKSVTFTPAFGMKNNTVELIDLFVVDEQSGRVRADPQVSQLEQGVYTTKIYAIAEKTGEKIGEFAHQFHLVNPDHKLKYVSDMSSNQMKQNWVRFTERFGKSVADIDSSGALSINFDQPTIYPTGVNRSSICFHMTRNDVVLDESTSMSLLSSALQTNTALSGLYHVYQIVNVERCEAQEPSTASLTPIPHFILLMVCGVAALVLLLSALCIYCCFVQRYKHYLENKEKNMKVDARPYRMPALGTTQQLVLPPPPPMPYY